MLTSIHLGNNMTEWFAGRSPLSPSSARLPIAQTHCLLGLRSVNGLKQNESFLLRSRSCNADADSRQYVFHEHNYEQCPITRGRTDSEGSSVFRVLLPRLRHPYLLDPRSSLSSYPPFPLIFSRGELHLSESALLQEHPRSSGAPMEGDFGAGTLPLFSFCTSADAGVCHVVLCKS